MSSPALFTTDIEPIREFRGDYEFLSNFHVAPMELSGPWWTLDLMPEDGWQSVEHAYQAAKVEPATPHFVEHYAAIANAATPGAAKKLGQEKAFREAGATMRAGWEQVKVPVMLACLRAKFRYTPLQDGNPLAHRLMFTSPRVLIEGNTWGDDYWGVPHGRTGKNMLGRTLMLVRAELLICHTAGLWPDELR